MNHTWVARAISQCHDHLNYGNCWGRAKQKPIHPFFWEFAQITLFDYHCAQTLDEVEEQATSTCMQMSLICLSNSGHFSSTIIFCKLWHNSPAADVCPDSNTYILNLSHAPTSVPCTFRCRIVLQQIITRTSSIQLYSKIHEISLNMTLELCDQ